MKSEKKVLVFLFPANDGSDDDELVNIISQLKFCSLMEKQGIESSQVIFDLDWVPPLPGLINVIKQGCLAWFSHLY